MIYNFNNLTFQILTVDIFRHKSGFYKVPARPYAALSLRTKGFGEFKIDGAVKKSSPGEILFIPEGLSYEVTYTEGESTVIHMTDCNYASAEFIAVNHCEYFVSAFQELLTSHKTSRGINSEKSLVYAILQHMSDDSSKDNAELKKCLSFIEKHFSEADLKISELCAVSNMSEATLRRKFSKIYGTSPLKYITNLRLKKAVELLLTGKYSVKETAFLCGFDDEKYFSRLFKEHYKTAPSSFKQGKFG